MEASRKTPTWGIVVGVLGILFGLLGLMGGTYELLIPSMFNMQEKMMTSMKEAARASHEKKVQDPSCPKGTEVTQDVDPTVMFQSMEEMWNIPQWYKKWAIVSGVLALLLGAAYILASIFLLVLRAGAPTLFLAIASLSMLRNIVSFIVGLSAGSFLAFWSISSAVGGFLIDLVLVIVVLVSDRTAYTSNE